jgi:hypothetical protein
VYLKPLCLLQPPVSFNPLYPSTPCLLQPPVSFRHPVSFNPLSPSGTLNLQNREMTVIPDDVYKLNDPELLQNLVGSDDDLKWWETEPIAKLYLCSNKIKFVFNTFFAVSFVFFYFAQLALCLTCHSFLITFLK